MFNPWSKWPSSGMAIASRLISITYPDAELVTRAIRRRLEEAGVTSESKVEIKLVDPIAWLVSLALLQIGATSYVSSGVPVAILPDYIIGEPTFDLTGFAKVIPFDSSWLETGLGSSAVSDAALGYPQEDKILRVIFTSGTSGKPKGVAISFSSLKNRLGYLRSYWADARTELNLMGLGATGGFYSALSAFTNGYTYFSAYPFTPESVKFLSEKNFELLTGSPIQISDLISALNQTGLTMSSIKKVRIAGASPSELLLDQIRINFTNAEIEILYGSTEGGGVTRTIVQIGDSPLNVGHAIEGVLLEIVDDMGKPLPRNVIGQIRYKTPGLIQGYIGDPDHSQKHFKGGWFHPGDNGEIDDNGSLVLAGRDSDIVNLDGIKINLFDFDQIAGAFPNVTDAAAFLAENRQGIQVLGLAVVGEKIHMKDLEIRLVSTLGISPKVFVRSNSIPRNANGKVDREALKQSFYRLRDGKR